MMKMKNTLTMEQTNDLLNGVVVGFFPFTILSTDAFYKHIYELCLGYYTQRSAEKTISLVYDRFIQLKKSYPSIDKTPEQLIGEIIRGKFLDKWERIYSALVTETYSVLHNREYNEKKIGNNEDKDTYDTTNKKEGTNTDTTTYDTNVVNDGKRGTHETTTSNGSTNENVFGYNSPSAVGDSTSNDTNTETFVGEADKNTTHNTEVKTGTESKSFGIDESMKHTGTEISEHSIDETITREGREGSGAELLEAELNLRNTQLFFDIIYGDIDSIATLQIYI